MRGWIALERGRLAAAEDDLRLSLELSEDVGTPMRPIAAMLALALAERGELEQAEALIAETRLAGELPEQQVMNLTLFFRARVRVLTGRAEEALADALEVGRRYERWGIRRAVPPWRSLAAVLLAGRGDVEEATTLVNEELELAERWGTALARATALRGAGLVARDAERIAAAAGELEDSPHRLELARTQVELGAALRRAGARAEARAPLRAGMDGAHACGAHLLAERARTELLATGARPRRLAATGADSLTPSERRVVDLAVEGRTNRQIAQDLFVTTATVETHLRHAFRKLDVSARAELAAALGRTSG
jgi:DNA-binding CsgD family transcriptional regulator/tetratricopeptide (TPR) repeat protein